MSETNEPDEHVDQLVPRPAPRSSFDQALLDFLALEPRAGRDGLRDGRRAAMRHALDYQASWHQIRSWRRARRTVPQWAMEMLAHKIAARRAVLDRGFNLLKEKDAR